MQAAQVAVQTGLVKVPRAPVPAVLDPKSTSGGRQHRRPAWEHVLTPVRPQDHYDWGLRAIKSVLVVAGSLKRGDPSRAEDQVLMRALRDFNIPKIVTDDLPVFMGLIGDLFPALDVPRKRDLNFEKVSTLGLESSLRDQLRQRCLPAEDISFCHMSDWCLGHRCNVGVGGHILQPTTVTHMRLPRLRGKP